MADGQILNVQNFGFILLRVRNYTWSFTQLFNSFPAINLVKTSDDRSFPSPQIKWLILDITKTGD
jgi:hypothetical protein